MMKIVLLFFSFILLAPGFSVAQVLDGFLSKYKKENNAEVLEISGKELSALRYMLPEQQKIFFKLVDKMATLTLKGCLPAVRERFYAEIASISPEGYLVEEHQGEGVGRTRVFIKVDKKKAKCTEVVIAAMDDNTDIALTILKGKFALEDLKVMFE